MSQGIKAAKGIKETPTARPSEYADMLKQARGADLEQKRLEELNRSIATGISAAQGAGGRAVVGALPGMIRASDAGSLDILAQRQAQTMQALEIGAQGAERELGRKMDREMMERQIAQSAIEGGLQNIAGGVGQIGTAATYSPKREFDDDGFKKGGMITGGKFDHKTNPIDIVKKGRKVGEMTGGEVILNPAQQQKLSKESAYFRQLLKKFNKQK